MRLLITGGAGFIGSNFVRYALGRDEVERVVNLDAPTYAGNLDPLADVDRDPRYRFVHGDIRDATLVADLVGEADAVVHFAAESHVDGSIDGALAFLDTNVTGAGVIFEACRQAEVERVLHISTDEVYGSIPTPDSFSASDPPQPNSPYAASKAAADLLARAYRITYGYPVTVTRTTNNFGPFHHPEKMIALLVTNLLDGRKVPLYGDGSNVGAGNELTNRALTHRLLEAFGVGDEMIEHVPDRPGHDLRYSVETTEVRALGWEPAHGLDEALASTIVWYRQHEAWWRQLTAAGASARQGAGT